MTSCIFSFVKRCALTLQKLNALNCFVKLLHYLFNHKIFICLVSEWLGYLYYQFYKCNKYEPYHYFNHIKRLKTLLAFLCHIMNSPYIITCIIWKKFTIIKITKSCCSAIRTRGRGRKPLDVLKIYNYIVLWKKHLYKGY